MTEDSEDSSMGTPQWEDCSKVSETKMVLQEKKTVRCCLGTKHSCPLNMSGGYCNAERCQYQVIEKGYQFY
jgi:hypothetical protein